MPIVIVSANWLAGDVARHKHIPVICVPIAATLCSQPVRYLTCPTVDRDATRLGADNEKPRRLGRGSVGLLRNARAQALARPGSQGYAELSAPTSPAGHAHWPAATRSQQFVNSCAQIVYLRQTHVYDQLIHGIFPDARQAPLAKIITSRSQLSCPLQTEAPTPPLRPPSRCASLRRQAADASA